MGNVGRLAQPLRVARRQRVPDLGLRRPYRLLGLAVMPLAAALLVVARAGGGTGVGAREPLLEPLPRAPRRPRARGVRRASRSRPRCPRFYLWQERRLKRREVTILRRQAPSLATLDRLAVRTVLFSLPALTLGLAVGLVRLLVDGDRIDAVVVATLVTWVVWSAYLVLRATRGWTGRRAAYVALVGFALVIVVRLALPAAHFA